MEFIDSHAHLNATEYKSNWQNIVQDSASAGITSIINNAGDLDSSEWGVEQAKNSDHLYATVGIHPEIFIESHQDVSTSDYNNLRRLINSSPKVVAIGEIGLDYTLNSEQVPIDKQHKLLTNQLAIAHQSNLPVTLHVRDLPGQTQCFADLLTILEQFTTSNNSSGQTPLTGVFHCWTGTPAQLEQALAIGFYISFSGILTYKSAGHILDAARLAPLNKILIETDAPYLIPEPTRSTQRPSVNLPEYVIMTAEKLASIKNVPLQTIAEATTQNTRRLFKLK